VRTSMTADGPRAGLRTRRLDAFSERQVRARLALLQEGVLDVVQGDSRESYGRPTFDGLRAELRVHDARFWTAVATGGSLGAGEAYIDGWWEADDLMAVVRILTRNQDVLRGMDDKGLARLGRTLLHWWHRRNRNTREGSRRNIQAHYDLSNEFFSLVLDPTMTYSCGIFEREDATLEEASVAKIDRLCRKLRLTPDDHLLEIGTGWGAFAVHAASEYGCRVTTTTLSKEQHAWAQRLIRERGLEDRIDLRLQDYRDLDGQYDKLVSVEMIEAVGADFLGEYFRVIGERLKPGGVAAIQAITIQDQRFEEAARTVDFIQRYVFPGSNIPSVTAMCEAMTAKSDLKLTHLEDITPHYARTLMEWRANLDAREEDVRALGLDDRFLRTWHFYLAYCAGGFAERHIGNVQVLVARPFSSHLPILPPLS